MSDGQTVGIASIAIGVLLIIGAVRGTWQKLFKDVVLNAGQQPTPSVNLATQPLAALPNSNPMPSNAATLYGTGNINNPANTPSQFYYSGVTA